MLVGEFAFQACLIDRSSISPFRINNLRTVSNSDIGDCDRSSNVPRSLTRITNIAADSIPHVRSEQSDRSSRAALSCRAHACPQFVEPVEDHMDCRGISVGE